MHKKLWYIVTGIMVVAIGAAVYWQQTKPIESKRIVIAEQYGLAYAPLQIMKEFKLLNKYLPEIEVEWKQLGNTAAIREAMLAGEVDAGFMAIPPFLIGYDKGMDWKIASGLSQSPVALVAYRPGIRSIKDFTASDRIALPQPGSVQHILLAMACEREWGDAKRLDNLLVALAHPDGMNALLAGKEVTAHFTTPPYLNKELKQPGIHRVLDGNAAMGGEFTFIVGVTTGPFQSKRSNAYHAFVKALAEAVDFVRHEPRKTAKILATQYKIPEDKLLGYLTEPGNEYTTSVKKVAEFADFMVRAGYLTQKPDLKQLYWGNVKHD